MDQGEAFRKIIIANEGCPKDADYALRFSDPDGVRSGKSGWSFGICQFDLSNNKLAAICLAECGFTPQEIAGLKSQTVDVKELEPKLRAGADTIARYDTMQLDGCLTRARVIIDKFGIVPSDDAALMAVADYDNQYHLSEIDKPGYLVHMLSRLSRPFIAKDVLEFKLECTKYGKLNPADCKRRYMNILRITQNG